VPNTDPLASQLVRIRLAGPHETGLVRGIDSSAFPEDSLDLQRAPAGELEKGVEARDVYLFELGERPIAYLHVDRSDPERINLEGFGVLPEYQSKGLGTAMMRLAQSRLAEHEEKLPIYSIASPRNTRMVRLLLNLRFAGRWVLPDHFGPGRHRVGWQLLRKASRLPEATETVTVPAADLGELHRLVRDGWVIVSPRWEGTQPLLVLALAGDGDFVGCPPPVSPAVPLPKTPIRPA
jgi:ribosomal protein S18 acetylase RimI-like enzyme